MGTEKRFETPMTVSPLSPGIRISCELCRPSCVSPRLMVSCRRRASTSCVQLCAAWPQSRDRPKQKHWVQPCSQPEVS